MTTIQKLKKENLTQKLDRIIEIQEKLIEILIVDTDKIIEKIFEKLREENKKARRKK